MRRLLVTLLCILAGCEYQANSENSASLNDSVPRPPGASQPAKVADPKSVYIVFHSDGATAEEIDTDVMRVIEPLLNSIAGVDSIRFDCVAGTAIATLTLKSEPRDALTIRHVSEVLQTTAAKLPDGITTTLSAVRPYMLPVAWVIVRQNADTSESAAAIQKLRAQLVALPDVSSVSLQGLREPQIRVFVDAEKLAAYGVMLSKVLSALRNASDASISIGNARSVVEQFETVLIQEINGQQTLLKDVARIDVGVQHDSLPVNLNGEPVVALGVVGSPNVPPSLAVAAVRSHLTQWQAALPPDVRIDSVIDPFNGPTLEAAPTSDSATTTFLLVRIYTPPGVSDEKISRVGEMAAQRIRSKLSGDTLVSGSEPDQSVISLVVRTAVKESNTVPATLELVRQELSELPGVSYQVRLFEPSVEADFDPQAGRIRIMLYGPDRQKLMAWTQNVAEMLQSAADKSVPAEIVRNSIELVPTITKRIDIEKATRLDVPIPEIDLFLKVAGRGYRIPMRTATDRVPIVVRFGESPATADELSRLGIVCSAGRIARLRDVADLVLAAVPMAMHRYRSRPMIEVSLNASKELDAQLLRASLDQLVTKTHSELMLTKDYQFHIGVNR